MIIITPDAARELLALAAGGGPAVLKLDAEPDGDGGFDCSVALVSEAPPEAELEEIRGVAVAFCGAANSVFAGAVIGLTPEGDLAVEMTEVDCESCSNGDCGSCGANEDQG